MIVFSIRRLIALVPVVAGVIGLVALMIHFVPGDPVDLIAGDFASENDKTEIREKLGLDQPVFHQVLGYYKGILIGDLGQSIIYGRSVNSLIAERALPTLELAIVSIIVAILIAIPLGVVAAIRSGTKTDFASMTFALLGVSIPNFWLGPMLVLLFSVRLNWFPVSERGDLSSYILPAITLGTALAAVLTRMTRTSFLENLKEDYVRTARSKGLQEKVVLFKHVLRNAALPVLTIVGLQFGVLLTGAIITEKIFDWPGLGSLILEAIGNRDYPLVQGCVLVFSTTYLMVNLLTDLGYAWLDPRIKLDR